MNSRTEIVIDQEALLHNIHCVKHWAPHSKIMAMVKANAYGHGVKKISQILSPEVDAFGVACLQEAIALRAISPHLSIVLMGGVFDETEWKTAFEKQLDVVIHHEKQLKSLFSYLYSHVTWQKINLWIKIDTGMHRLGFMPEEVPAIYQQLLTCAAICPSIVLMTHFACADEIDNPMNKQQEAVFNQVIHTLFASPLVGEDARRAGEGGYLPIQSSMANSAAIMTIPSSHRDYVRPGIMLYGISPFADKTGRDLGLKPAMSFLSHVMSVKTCKKGESVGYDATWRATQDSLIAIVAAGYGDGYPRHISSEAVVWSKGYYLPIIGRVSMDMLAIDISSHTDMGVGESVELWGEHLPVERVACFANTSPYELVTQVHKRNGVN